LDPAVYKPFFKRQDPYILPGLFLCNACKCYPHVINTNSFREKPEICNRSITQLTIIAYTLDNEEHVEVDKREYPCECPDAHFNMLIVYFERPVCNRRRRVLIC